MAFICQSLLTVLLRKGQAPSRSGLANNSLMVWIKSYPSWPISEHLWGVLSSWEFPTTWHLPLPNPASFHSLPHVLILKILHKKTSTGSFPYQTVSRGTHLSQVFYFESLPLEHSLLSVFLAVPSLRWLFLNFTYQASEKNRHFTYQGLKESVFFPQSQKVPEVLSMGYHGSDKTDSLEHSVKCLQTALES